MFFKKQKNLLHKEIKRYINELNLNKNKILVKEDTNMPVKKKAVKKPVKKVAKKKAVKKVVKKAAKKKKK